MKQHLRFGAAIIITLGALAGCGGASKPTYGDLGEMRDDYRLEAAKLSLPPGQDWPTHGEMWLVPDQPAADGHFEDGFGRLTADSIYLCSWERTFINSPSDTPARVVSLARLEAFAALHAYTSSYDTGTQQQFDHSLALARRGNASGLDADVRSNCQPTAWRNQLKISNEAH